MVYPVGHFPHWPTEENVIPDRPEGNDGNLGLISDRNNYEIDGITPKVFQVEGKTLREQAMSTVWDIRHGVRISGNHASS